MKRKVLYSPNFGSGWSSRNRENYDACKYMATCPYVIAAVEHKEKLTECSDVVVRMKKYIKRKWGVDVYTFAASDLKIENVNGRFRIEDYDGSETVIDEGQTEWM